MNRFYIKTSVLLLFGAALLVSLPGCTDDAEEQARQEAKLTTFAPEAAGKNTMMTLNGENLGASRKNTRVWINATEVEVINVTQTKINVRVPDKVGSGPIRVMIGDRELTYGTAFSYVPDYLVSTLAGSGVEASGTNYKDGPAAEATFLRIADIVYDPTEDAVLALETDASPRRLRRIKDGEVTTVIPKFDVGNVNLNNPKSLAFSITRDTIFVGNDNSNNVKNLHAVGILLRSENFAVAHPYISTEQAISPNINYAVANPVYGTLVYYCYSGKVYVWDAEQQQASELGDVLGFIKENSAGATGSEGMVRFSPDGKTLYVVLRTPYHGILSANYDPAAKKLTSPFRKFVGSGKSGKADGSRTDATFNQPMSCFFGLDGNMYVAERENNCVRRVTPEGNVTLFAGTMVKGDVDGPAGEAQFFLPRAITVDADGAFHLCEYRDGTAGAGNRIRTIKPEM